jgi:hypothetical protein
LMERIFTKRVYAKGTPLAMSGATLSDNSWANDYQVFPQVSVLGKLLGSFPERKIRAQ